MGLEQPLTPAEPSLASTAFEGVILDVDGTLVDTNYQHSLAWYEAFRQRDVVIPIWRIHRHVGMGGDQLVRAVAGDRVEDEHGDGLRAAHDVLYMAMIQSVSVLEGARRLLCTLKAAGRRVVLASSAKAQEVDHYLDLLDARDIVDGWTTAADVQKTKPNPDLVEAAVDRLGTRRAVMVGDTPWDVEAAKKAQLPTIAVLTGGFSRGELIEAGAMAVYDSISDLHGDLEASVLRAI